MSSMSSTNSAITPSQESTRCQLFNLGIAELIGTFLLTLLGNAAVGSAILSTPYGQQINPLIGALGYAIGLGISIYATGSISGAHLNPAVSFAFFTRRRFSLKPCIIYIIAQYIGAFMSSVCVYGIYFDQIWSYDSQNLTEYLENSPDADTASLSLKTAGIFATYPNENSSMITCFFDQLFATAILLILIEMITDKHNPNVPSPAMQPVAIAVALFCILLAFTLNCGAALNPARDLSPRIFTAFTGWGDQVFSTNNYLWFWIPIVGPHLGAIIGTWAYTFTLGAVMRQVHSPASDATMIVNPNWNIS